jgi:hypothetical protein
MPDSRYHDLKNDADHVDNQKDKRSESYTGDRSAYKAKPSDLGYGAAANVADAILKHKKELDEI